MTCWLYVFLVSEPGCLNHAILYYLHRLKMKGGSYELFSAVSTVSKDTN